MDPEFDPSLLIETCDPSSDEPIRSSDDSVGTDSQYRPQSSYTTISTSTWTWCSLPYNSVQEYCSEQSSYFSKGFLGWLIINTFFIYGGVYTLVKNISVPLFKELGITASNQQIYSSLIYTPWAMKAFIGVASDLFPILGYNQRYYILIAIVVGVAGSSGLLILAPLLGIKNPAKDPSANLNDVDVDVDVDTTLIHWIILCLIALSYMAATLDHLGDSKSAELMNLHPESGSSIVSFKFGWYLAGSIMVSALVGPLSDNSKFFPLFLICLFFVLTPLLPTLLGWIPETVRIKEDPGMMALCGDCLLFDRGAFWKRSAQFSLAILCGLASPLVSFMAAFVSIPIGLVFAAVILVSFCLATYFVFPISFFWIFLANILIYISSTNIDSALQYYYTASEECVPNGPHFSYSYFIAVNGIVGPILGLISVALYEKFLSSWRFRSVLIFTYAIWCFVPVVDIIIITRLNQAIGISDKVLYFFGEAIGIQLIGTCHYIPMSAIYSKMSPPGMESTVYAYVIGMTNFCRVLNLLIGSWVIQWSGMTTLGKDCDFKALPYLVVAFKIVIPFLIAIPAMCLIPNVLQTEHMIDWESNEPISSGLDYNNQQDCRRLFLNNESDLTASNNSGIGEDTVKEII